MAEQSAGERPSVQIRADDAAAASMISSSFGVSEICGRIMSSRGISDVVRAGEYLFPRMSVMHSPFHLRGMDDAVSLIRSRMKSGGKIAIFSDSDIDGLTSLAIVRSVFDTAGIKSISRFPVGEENYGLTRTVIDEAHKAGADLLLTLDCGVRDIDEICYAKSLGMETVVCDHHEQGDSLPDAVVIDPKIQDSGYPFRDLAGASVALKLCHAFLFSFLSGYNRDYLLIRRDERSGELGADLVRNGVCVESLSGGSLDRYSSLAAKAHTVFYGNVTSEELSAINSNADFVSFEQMIAANGDNVFPGMNMSLLRALKIPDTFPADTGALMREYFYEISFNRPGKIRSFLKIWMPFAMLGTVADIVTLQGENRVIASCGLAAYAESDHPPFSVLRREFGDTDVHTVSWKVAPLLNTPGRLGRTDLSADFFLGSSVEECDRIIGEIRKLNEERKRSVKEYMEHIIGEIDAGRYSMASNFVFVMSDKVTDGFTGLVANRIADYTGKPAIVVSETPDRDVFKGSGRAPDGVDFLSYIEPFSDMFERFGGHSRAFGFSIERGNIERAVRSIDEAMKHLIVRTPSLTVDLKPESPVLLNSFFRKDYGKLEPFGPGNDCPLFLTENAACDSFQTFGKEANHGKFMFSGIAAVAWNRAEEMRSAYDKGGGLSLVYRIEEDAYTKRMRMMIDDFWTEG
jgi:single-stranded-DNA-specific exonuclease